MISDDTWKFVEQAISDLNLSQEVSFKAASTIMVAPESPILESAHVCSLLLLKALGRLINDDEEWLEWWVYDDDCGEKGFVAKVDGVEYKMETMDDLRKVLSAGKVVH